jgi:hypothetical protein
VTRLPSFQSQPVHVSAPCVPMSRSTDKVVCTCSAKCIRAGLVSRRTYNRHANRRNQLPSFNVFQQNFGGGSAEEDLRSDGDGDGDEMDHLQEEGLGIGGDDFHLDHDLPPQDHSSRASDIDDNGEGDGLEGDDGAGDGSDDDGDLDSGESVRSSESYLNSN